MKKYSDYFKTLHDETRPTGTLGRGTHYSIIRSKTWLSSNITYLKESSNHDLAIIWDEDHDERVIQLIEQIYQKGLLSPAIFVGERKGSFSLIIDENTLSNLPNNWLRNYSNQIEQLADNLEDPWGAEVSVLNSKDIYIVNAEIESVTLYLNNLKMLWKLGIHNISDI